MKTLLILRHAKSDWGDFSLPDFDRPLNKRGQKDAPRMGVALAKLGLKPDLILASPAVRAKQTTQLLAEAVGYTKKVQWVQSFYGGTSEDIFTALHDLSPQTQTVLVVGHNPTMQETVSALCTDDDETMALNFPTAALACLDLDLEDWDEVGTGAAILRWLIVPKLIKAL